VKDYRQIASSASANLEVEANGDNADASDVESSGDEEAIGGDQSSLKKTAAKMFDLDESIPTGEVDILLTQLAVGVKKHLFKSPTWWVWFGVLWLSSASW